MENTFTGRVIQDETRVGSSPVGCARYIRGYSHDLRNCLTAVDLQTVLLGQLARTESESSAVGTIQKVILCMEELQLRLGLRFQIPQFGSVALSSVFEECHERQRLGSSPRKIDWSLDGPDCWFRGDEQAVIVLVVELADYWFAACGGSIRVFSRGRAACIQMQRTGTGEHRADSEVGDELTALVSRYGGILTMEEDGNELEVTFPLARPAEDGGSE